MAAQAQVQEQVQAQPQAQEAAEEQVFQRQDEYESDAEEAPLALALRRRQASDDEEDDDRDRAPLQGFSGHETEDDEGAPPLEDDEEEELDDEEELEQDDDNGELAVEEEIDEDEYEDEDYDDEEEDLIGGSRTTTRIVDDARAQNNNNNNNNNNNGVLRDQAADQAQGAEEKKEPEPFAVPTAGAFYMHDDRFRDNGSARPRRMFGGRKLWEAKDDRAWVHDRFEELNLQDEERQRRRGRGHFRGRGRGRGGGRGQGRFNRSRMYSDNAGPQYVRRGTDRGRGMRRPLARRNVDGFVGSNKQVSDNVEALANRDYGKRIYHSQSGTAHQDAVNDKKNVVSSLSSASPPFYPSGVQNHNLAVSGKREQRGVAVGNIHSSARMDEQMSTENAAATSRNGKAQVNVSGHAQMYAESSQRSDKQFMNIHQTSKSSSNHASLNQPLRRNAVSGGQSISQPNNNVNVPKSSSFTSSDSVSQHRNIQNQVQGSPRVSSQHMIQQGSNINPPPSRTDASESGDAGSPPDSNKNKALSVGRNRGNSQGVGRSSYLYNGTQSTAGTSGMTMADQSFTHTPALLPVMPLGGQHTGLGVPAVGMALPGYVAQPQLGFGSSEMTWVPLFAGHAGTLGASYCPPYIAVDGNYYAQQGGQSSALGTSGRDSSGNKAQSSWKQQPSRSEMVNDEFGQRQNKPRRYSEMNSGRVLV